MTRRGALFLVLFATSGSALAGVFSKAELGSFDPFIVVHPPGYNGSPGTLALGVCVTGAASGLVPALQGAIATLDSLAPTTQNCVGPCFLVDESVPAGSQPFSTESVLMHELLHCLGLGHHNDAATSFTNTRDETSIDDGNDDIRGSFDDIPAPLPGARVLHWFRINAASAGDNDPVTIDATVIQDGTFTRRIQDLTGPNRWPASANRAVSNSLGFSGTASVMLSLPSPRTRYTGLTADDVNTLQFGMAGLDELVGGGDDYVIDLEYVEGCGSAQIEIDFSPTLPPGTDPAAIAVTESVALLIAGSANHYRIDSGLPGVPVTVTLKSTELWDHVYVFLDEFETGDFRWWTGQQPAP